MAPPNVIFFQEKIPANIFLLRQTYNVWLAKNLR